MKTFDDLKFELHPLGTGSIAKIKFDNGYGASVLNGERFYTNNRNEYELAVTKNGVLCYDTPITDDVIGYLSREEVTDLMKKIQELK